MNYIDISAEAIADKIKSNLAKSKYKSIEEGHDFQGHRKIDFRRFDSKYSELVFNLSRVNQSCNILTKKYITSDRKILGRFIIFTKKFIRKMLGWYITPIIEQENTHNSFVTKTLNNVFNILRADVAYKEEISNLKNTVDELSSQLSEINHKYEEIKRKADFSNIHFKRYSRKPRHYSENRRYLVRKFKNRRGIYL